jgi:hypothetical protein
MTYALREACSRAARALATPIALLIALVAHAALGLSGEPFHADGKQRSMAGTERSDRRPPEEIVQAAFRKPWTCEEDNVNDCHSVHEPVHAEMLRDGHMPLDLGAGERIRTADLPFTRRLLCQLSYTGGNCRHASRRQP